MIRLVTGVPLLVCWWCAAEAAQDSEQLDRRLSLVEAQRAQGRLAAAESMLAGLQAEIGERQPPGYFAIWALREHGLLRDDEGKPDEAIPFYERALAMLRAQPAPGPVTIGLLLASLASSHADCGDSALGLSYSTEAMTVLRTAAGSTSPDFAVALYAHAVALRSLHRNTEALRDLREALDIWHHSTKPDDPQLALVHEAIGTSQAELGYLNQAEASEREALAIRTRILEPDSVGIAATLNNLGVILSRAQRFSEARQSLERAVQIFAQSGESEQQRLAAALGNLGRIYFNQARMSAPLYAKAEEAYRRQLAIEEGLFGSSDVRIAATLEMLGEVLYQERAFTEAGRTYGRGLAIQQAAFGPADPKTQAAAKRYNFLVKKMKPDPER